MKGAFCEPAKHCLLRLRKTFPVTGMRTNSSEGDVSLQMNGLYTIDAVDSEMEWKGYQGMDSVFPFVPALENPATGSINY